MPEQMSTGSRAASPAPSSSKSSSMFDETDAKRDSTSTEPVPSSSNSSSVFDETEAKRDLTPTEPAPSKQTRRAKWQKRTLTFLSDQWFLIGMCIMIPIVSQHQLPLSMQQAKATGVFYSCVSVIFIITGCTLDSSILKRNYKRWRTHIWVQVQCFAVCSIFMFGIVSAAGTNRTLDEGLLVGLAVLGCMPTTIASNVVMTAQANGNSELTLVETTIGNLIGIFISPALVVGYTKIPVWYMNAVPETTPSDMTAVFGRVAKQFGLSIYLPFFVGQIIRHFFTPQCDLVFKKYKVSKLGSVAILVILWATYDQAFASGAFSSLSSTDIIFLIFTLLGIWMAWFALGFGLATLLRYPRKDVIAITYCVAAKGPAISVPLIDRIWPTIPLELVSRLQVPVAIYQTMQIALGSLMVVLLRKYIEREELRKKEKEAGFGVDDEERILAAR